MNEKIEKKVAVDLIEAINNANYYADENDIAGHRFALGKVSAYLSVLDCMGHETSYEFSRKKQYGLHGTHKFERIEKVLVDNDIVYQRRA